jgi:hypothetical protein
MPFFISRLLVRRAGRLRPQGVAQLPRQDVRPVLGHVLDARMGLTFARFVISQLTSAAIQPPLVSRTMDLCA